MKIVQVGKSTEFIWAHMSMIHRHHWDKLTLSLADNCAVNDIQFLFSIVLFLVIVVLKLTSKHLQTLFMTTQTSQVVQRSLTLSDARDEFLGCSPPGNSFSLIPLRWVPRNPMGSGGWTVFPWFCLCVCKVLPSGHRKWTIDQWFSY